ncbi:hypothetical protein JYU34_003731 [Plutella xylostella]|uniref:Snurportin-1 n=1 Tax=Plutella xylostella TaxID=51655 RepID=A0ABQ7R0S4_PLUXY|nr:hypothetical protein JYU34_003731 [Plutella xylostella]
MDEVLEKFQSLGDQDADNTKSDFEGMYKNWGRLGHQEERRKEILEVQKSNRMSKFDYSRDILQLVLEAEEEFDKKHYGKPRYRPSIYVAGFNKVSSRYKNVLMMSEWMVEKPQDFNENWLVVPCPKGVRLLVVASRGITKCYTKYGHFKMEIRTALPGGNPGNQRGHTCVLDCFYVEKNNTMYVVDILAYNSQPMTDGETEFRHFWIHSKFAELPGLKIISKQNKAIFTILPKVPCDEKSLNEFMSKYPAFECNFPPLDGFLFYHKKAQYVSGETPLVGWLFPYMVNEVLGDEVTVNPMYLTLRPFDYKNQREFIEKFEVKLDKKKPKGFRTSLDSDTSASIADMETSTPNTADNTENTMDTAKPSEESPTEENKEDNMDVDAAGKEKKGKRQKKNTKKDTGNQISLEMETTLIGDVLKDE